MPNRSWFYANGGQQQGPLPEGQFRDLIARGIIRADTLIWTDGMSGWQKAGDIPGLLSPAARPPAMPRRVPAPAGSGSESLSIDFEILDFVRQALLFVIGAIFIVPLPWVLVSSLKWVISHTRVPGRPDLTFTGNAMTIVWWFLGAVALIIMLNFIGGRIASIVSFLIEVGLGWLAIRWFLANLASAGRGCSRRRPAGSTATSKARGARLSSRPPAWNISGAPLSFFSDALSSSRFPGWCAG